jgi:hypothetical protein
MSPPNHVLITLDSCRHDVFAGAEVPRMRARGAVLEALAPAHFTFPSHLSMLQGMTPDCRHPFPYYNRFVSQLWRCPLKPDDPDRTAADAEPGDAPARTFFRVAGQSPSFPLGLAAMGYRTLGAGAMGWMKHPFLQQSFQTYKHTGIDAPRQLAFARKQLDRLDGKPFFLLLNLGETHAPYAFGDDLDPARVAPLKEQYQALKREQRRDPSYTTHFGFFDRQRAAVAYLDRLLGELFDFIEARFPSTVVMICGDHGDAMGEDNLWGHGFVHPKVMSVPLLIFELGGERVLAPLHEAADRIAAVSEEEIAASRAEEARLRSPEYRTAHGLQVRAL